jgi:outer membrane protein assembly factor BamB
VLCFGEASGQKLWERQFWATGNTFCHAKTCMAAPTPATDGERVYALFATGDLACLDADGDLLWYRALARDYPHVSNQVGMAASPVLYKDVLLVPMETADESFAAGLDRLTGRNRWKVGRPRDINWVTPVLVCNHRRDEVLFLSSGELTAYDPLSGRKYWSYSGEGVSPTPSVPSPAVGDDLIVTGSGLALRPGTDRAPPEVVWRANKLKPAYASPLYYRGRVYAVNNTGVLLNCFDATDGKTVWQQRIKGPVSASPVVADGKIYLVNEEGVTTVLEAGARTRVLGTNRLAETVLATPAVAGGALFLRSDRHLYCIGRAP